MKVPPIDFLSSVERQVELRHKTNDCYSIHV